MLDTNYYLFIFVGKDKYADKLREIAEQAGVNVQYQVDESTPTGTCAVLITEKDR